MAKKHESAQAQKNKAFIAIVKKNRYLYGYESPADFAVALGTSPRTMQRRLANPDKLSRLEQARIFEALKFTDEERAACV